MSGQAMTRTELIEREAKRRFHQCGFSEDVEMHQLIHFDRDDKRPVWLGYYVPYVEAAIAALEEAGFTVLPAKELPAAEEPAHDFDV